MYNIWAETGGPHKIQYIQNLQTSQGYIFRILPNIWQPNLCNFTHFKIRFLAVRSSCLGQNLEWNHMSKIYIAIA